MAFAFDVINARGIQPPQAALHRHRQIVPGAAAQLLLHLLQLLRKRKVRHRLEDIIQRPHRIALDGILRHIGDEHEHHLRVQLPDAPGRLHTVQMLHLDIQKDQVIGRAVILQDLQSVREGLHLKRGPVLPGVPLNVSHQLLPDLRFILHDGYPYHLPHLPASGSPAGHPNRTRHLILLYKSGTVFATFFVFPGRCLHSLSRPVTVFSYVSISKYFEVGLYKGDICDRIYLRII